MQKKELMQDIVHVHVTTRFEKDWIISNREKMEKSFKTLTGSYMVDQALMHVLLALQYQTNWIKTTENNGDTIFPIIWASYKLPL